MEIDFLDKFLIFFCFEIICVCGVAEGWGLVRRGKAVVGWSYERREIG
jgi:hypothetical protein